MIDTKTKLQRDGNFVYAIKDNGHSILSFSVSRGCLCTACCKDRLNANELETIAEFIVATCNGQNETKAVKQ